MIRVPGHGRRRPSSPVRRLAGPLVAVAVLASATPAVAATSSAISPAPALAATTSAARVGAETPADPPSRTADPTVVLLTPVAVRTAPERDAPRVTTIAARRPITGVRTVLPVVRRTTDATGRRWLRVRLPGRVLGSPAPPPQGWILEQGTRSGVHPWRIVVDVEARRVTVFRDRVRLRSFRAVVGTAETPTPRGRFFVEENVRIPSDRTGGPFALATSARSSVLQEFDGGPGQIALHGRDGIGGRLGTAVSHGCVRLADREIAWIADRVAPGALITFE